MRSAKKALRLLFFPFVCVIWCCGWLLYCFDEKLDSKQVTKIGLAPIAISNQKAAKL